MGKLWKSALIGGVIYALWVMIVGLYQTNQFGVSRFTDEGAILDAVEEGTSGSGLYFIPMENDPGRGASVGTRNAASVDFWNRYTDGPHIFVVYSEKLNNPRLMIIYWLIIQFIVAFIASALLRTTTGLQYWGRVWFVVLVATTGSVGMHLENWLEPAYNHTYIMASIANVLIGWFLAGMAMVKWGMPKEKQGQKELVPDL